MWTAYPSLQTEVNSRKGALPLVLSLGQEGPGFMLREGVSFDFLVPDYSNSVKGLKIPSYVSVRRFVGQES